MAKRALFFLFVCFLIPVCAKQPVVYAQVKYAVIPESPRAGDPLTVSVNTEVKEAALLVGGKQVAKARCFLIPGESVTVVQPQPEPQPKQQRRNRNTRQSAPAAAQVIKQPDVWTAILAVPSTVTSDSAVIKLSNGNTVVQEIIITLAPREFKSETIKLTPALTSLVSDPNPQRTKESERLWEILSTTGNEVYHWDTFVMPTASTRRTSQFGTRRINQYSDGRAPTSIHAGVDFGTPTGSEVYACGRGKVILSRMRIISGYSIIIEHAPGVYSIYYHLDSVIAQEDSIVEAGQVIGLSGSTGFSTGPHLHWEIRVSTENTDPDVFIERPLIDKKLIISKIGS